MKKLFLLLTLLPAIAFAAPIKQEPKGTIIVYRRFAYMASGRSFPFYFNGTRLKLRINHYFKFEVPPGTYKLVPIVSAVVGVAWNQPAERFETRWPRFLVTANVKAGETIYVEARYTAWNWRGINFGIVPNAEGREHTRNHKEQFVGQKGSY
jgi:hypothetical protein